MSILKLIIATKLIEKPDLTSAQGPLIDQWPMSWLFTVEPASLSCAYILQFISGLKLYRYLRALTIVHKAEFLLLSAV
jgi:hypothetical protein